MQDRPASGEGIRGGTGRAGHDQAIGAIAALGVGYILASQLEVFMFDTFDGVAYGMSTLLVITASAAAAYFPSRRAARIDPTITLRYD